MVEPATFGSGINATIAAPTGSQRSRGICHSPSALRLNSGRPAANGSTTARGEEARLLRRRRHLTHARNAFLIAQAFVVREPERSVLHYRTAGSPAELIAVALRLRCTERVREEIVRVEIVVAKKLVDASANRIGSGLDRRVDDRAGAAAEFSGVGVGLNLELLQRLDRGLHQLDVLAAKRVRVGNIVHAIEQEDVIEGAVPVHIEHTLEVHAGQPRRARQNAWREQRELVVIASVQRQLDDLLLADDRPARRRHRVEQRRPADHFHGFGDLAGLQRDVYTRDLGDLQRDP